MNHTMSNFFHEFAAAAQAMEELPIVKAALEGAKAESADLRDIIQRLELQAIDRKNEIDVLNARIRSLEVERDDAQFQALEEQDRTSAFKRFVEAMFGQAGNLLQASAPAAEVKPEREEPIRNFDLSLPSEAHIDGPMVGHARDYANSSTGEGMGAGEGPSEAGEFGTTSSAPTEAGASPTLQSLDINQSMSADATVGESAADPIQESNALSQSADQTLDGARTIVIEKDTASVQASEGVSVPSDPTQATESSSESDLSGSQVRPRPYEGKRYVSVPHYVSLVEWLNGGGTEADYYAR